MPIYDPTPEQQAEDEKEIINTLKRFEETNKVLPQSVRQRLELLCDLEIQLQKLHYDKKKIIEQEIVRIKSLKESIGRSEEEIKKQAEKIYFEKIEEILYKKEGITDDSYLSIRDIQLYLYIKHKYADAVTQGEPIKLNIEKSALEGVKQSIQIINSHAKLDALKDPNVSEACLSHIANDNKRTSYWAVKAACNPNATLAVVEEAMKNKYLTNEDCLKIQKAHENNPEIQKTVEEKRNELNESTKTSIPMSVSGQSSTPQNNQPQLHTPEPEKTPESKLKPAPEPKEEPAVSQKLNIGRIEAIEIQQADQSILKPQGIQQTNLNNNTNKEPNNLESQAEEIKLETLVPAPEQGVSPITEPEKEEPEPEPKNENHEEVKSEKPQKQTKEEKPTDFKQSGNNNSKLKTLLPISVPTIVPANISAPSTIPKENHVQPNQTKSNLDPKNKETVQNRIDDLKKPIQTSIPMSVSGQPKKELKNGERKEAEKVQQIPVITPVAPVPTNTPAPQHSNTPNISDAQSLTNNNEILASLANDASKNSSVANSQPTLWEAIKAAAKITFNDADKDAAKPLINAEDTIIHASKEQKYDVTITKGNGNKPTIKAVGPEAVDKTVSLINEIIKTGIKVKVNMSKCSERSINTIITQLSTANKPVTLLLDPEVFAGLSANTKQAYTEYQQKVTGTLQGSLSRIENNYRANSDTNVDPSNPLMISKAEVPAPSLDWLVKPPQTEKFTSQKSQQLPPKCT